MMKLRGTFLLSIAAIAVMVFAFILPQQSSDKEAVLIQTILGGLNRYHYQPTTIDDEFSAHVYDLYMKRLDGSKRWLTQEDVQLLEAHKYNLDEESRAGTYEFFDLSVELLEAAIDKTETYYKTYLEQPFDFSVNEEFELDGEKRDFAKNDKELEARWEKTMKYEVLTRLYDKLKAQEEGKDEDLAGKSREELEAEVRKDVLKVFDGWYSRIRSQKRADRMSNYLNAVTNIFDPHTGYFKPIDKENFDINMSGRLEGIGARLQTDDEYTKITDIIVGGPAWKQGELKEGDKIMSVTQEDGEVIDITGMQINDVVQQIRGPKETKVTLTVKRVDGTVEDITIIRDVVIIEEGFAKSLLIEGNEGEKVGYIRLPRFYADFADATGRQCSRDVLTEINKLKDSKVDGIILDLRSNGGGSLRDVVSMSGYFIEDGPIVQVKARDRKPDVLTDDDKSVQYDGPLIVMVNNFSASASEILAAAMQDYGRAVIVGSSSTFGKGTVQRFLDLDRSVRAEDIKPLGEIKLTTQKFYRVDGGSTQLRGVVPDIILPDNYALIETGEAEHDYPMKWSEIEAVDYQQQTYKVPNLEELKNRSTARVVQNPSFKKVAENAQRWKEQRDDTMQPLSFDKYAEKTKREEKESEVYEDLFDQVVLDKVSNLSVDQPAIDKDESKKARNDEWIEDIAKDFYIQETMSILHDMIELKS